MQKWCIKNKYIVPCVYMWYVELDNGMRKSDLDQKCVAWGVDIF